MEKTYLKLLTTTCYQARLDLAAHNAGLFVWCISHYIIVPTEKGKKTISTSIGTYRNGVIANIGDFAFTRQRLKCLEEMLELIDHAETELRLHPEFIDL